MKRPWGLLHQVLSRLECGAKWDLIGAVSFEERCNGALEILSKTKRLGNRFLFDITDTSPRYREKARAKTNAHIGRAKSLGIDEKDILNIDLLSPANAYVGAIESFLNQSDGHVILDISSLPKRIFYPCLKLALANPKVKSLIAAYSCPESYTEESLATDTDPFGGFPLFSPATVHLEEPKVIIVGVGYLPFDLTGLTQQLSSKVPVNVLFPFPPGPPSFQRNWQFLLDIFGEAQSSLIPEPIRVDARDASYAFDLISDITDKGGKNSYLLPYGPKPHSFAMALHFLGGKGKDQLLYTQPKAYHYDYSIGLKRQGDFPETYGYCVILNKKNLYTV